MNGRYLKIIVRFFQIKVDLRQILTTITIPDNWFVKSVSMKLVSVDRKMLLKAARSINGLSAR